MKQMMRKMLCILLCAAMLVGFVLASPLSANAHTTSQQTTFSQYATLAKVYEQSGCYSMQGMAVHGDYVYACKTNNGTDTKAVVARINIHDGSKTFLTNTATGTYVFEDFVHGNEIEVETIGGVTTMFIPTMASGSESLIRYAINGTTATRVGNYTMTCGGSNIAGGAIRVMHYSENYITFIFKTGNDFYTGTIPVNQYSGTVEMTKLFSFEYSTMYINGVQTDISGFSLQGFEYYDGKIYLPLSGHTVSGMANVAIILVYDTLGATGTIEPDRNLSFYVASEEYPAYFEIESCGISPLTGKLYFNTNSRVTSSDTNHDGVHYFTDWEYKPAERNNDVNNYRWEVKSDKLTSVLTNGSALNHLNMIQGSVTSGNFNYCRYSTDRTVILEHERPWELEWQASGGAGGFMLFATEGICTRANAPFLYRHAGTSVISLGVYDGSQYHSYGLDLSDYGIDADAAHLYRLRNKVNAAGNMVYLSVDGVELGAMKNYYIDGVAQGTTSGWISGMDFRFSYLGPIDYRLHNINISYIQVWGNGEGYQPNRNFRWQTLNNSLTGVSGEGLTVSTPTLLAGDCTNGVYSGTRYALSESITLMHDQPWTIQWKGKGNTGGGCILSADNMGDTTNSYYLFRNGNVITIGYWSGSSHLQYGIDPSDYSVDMSVNHIFTLQNKVYDDGSNMIYLSVDGKELGAMNNHYKNAGDTGTTSAALSGKDFVFTWMGAYPYAIDQQTIDYLQVWEQGILGGDTADRYRWETRNNALTSISTDGYTQNDVVTLAGSCTDGVYSKSYMELSRSVVLRHDRNWIIEWKCEGAWNGGFLLSSALSGYTTNVFYLFRNTNILGIGRYTGSRHEQSAIAPADYGVDMDALHTYRLVNRIDDNGNNMVYLFVDDVQLGALNNLHVNGSASSSGTTDWLNGTDFVFSYVGTSEFPLNNASLEYLQINEGCVHDYEAIVTAPTCYEDGYTTYTCSLCGDSYVGDIVSAGHSWVNATCTSAKYCVACGATDGKAPGHSYNAVVTAPTCSAFGYTSYICTVCGDSYMANMVSATGHNYIGTVTAPTCTLAGYTTYTCAACGDSYTGDHVSAAGHSYAQGFCTSCGVKDPNYSDVVVPTLTLNYPSLSFEDEILYNVYYTVDDTSSIVEMGLITFNERLTEGTIADAVDVIPGYVSSGSTYMAQSHGIPAKNLGDAVYFKVYAKLTDGSYVYTDVAGYHAVAYANTVLNSTAADKAKALVVAMLNYGAAAQEYFGYKTDALMNAGLTAEQQALVSAYDSSMVQDVVKADSSKVGSFVMNGGYSNIFPTVSFEGAFAINFYFTPNKTVDNGLTFYYWDAKTYASVDVLSTENATGVITMAQDGSNWGAAVEGIAAKAIDETVYVAAIYTSGGVSYPTGIVAYSLGNYCKTLANNGTEFGAATAVYGYYAKAYFAS